METRKRSRGEGKKENLKGFNRVLAFSNQLSLKLKRFLSFTIIWSYNLEFWIHPVLEIEVSGTKTVLRLSPSNVSKFDENIGRHLAQRLRPEKRAHLYAKLKID